MFTYPKTSSFILSFFIFNAIAFLSNSFSVYAKSIDTETTPSVNNVYKSYIKLPTVISIVGVVAIVATGGFCLFSSKKKQKRMSEEYLTRPSSHQLSTSSSTPTSSNSEVREFNVESEEADISIKVDHKYQMDNSLSDESNHEPQPQPKRKSLLDSILNRNPSKEKRKSNIQFVEDRSLNSISTNADWITEQKYQAELRHETPDELYDEEDVNSNDGFWNSDLEPIQSSSNNKQESYAVPSLGSRNSVIIKGSESGIPKRQSVIIVNDDPNLKSSGSSVGSNDLRPTRVKSWKDNDLDKELKEILKNIDEEAKLNNIKEEFDEKEKN